MEILKDIIIKIKKIKGTIIIIKEKNRNFRRYWFKH